MPSRNPDVPARAGRIGVTFIDKLIGPQNASQRLREALGVGALPANYKSPVHATPQWIGPHRNPKRNAVRKIRRAIKQMRQNQHPKAIKVRVHKPHKHMLRDEHGAYTMVGRNMFGARRKWLAGVSAQRGF